MKKRILWLTTLAAMMAAAMALSGVAQAKPTTATKADAKCLAEAAKTVQQPGFNPADYTFHGGSDVTDIFDVQATEGNDVFCGFGSEDAVMTLEAGDIFLGGEGNDGVDLNNGTFYGGPGSDFVSANNGTFNGGADKDFVTTNFANGTFNGEAGDDEVVINNGIFNGGDGLDSVRLSNTGTTDAEVLPT